MANPNFPSDGQNERVDAVVTAAGVANLKLGVGDVAPTGAVTHASWTGVATHVDGVTAATTDGVVVIAGTVGTGAAAVKHLLVDASGRPIVVGAAATTTAVSGAPVLVGGSNGTNAYTLLTDTAGRPQISGATATGNALAGNPVLVGGSDGTNARNLLTDTLGNLVSAADSLTVFKSIQATGTGNTNVWTPTTGKKFRLKRLFVMLSDDASLGTAAVLTIKFQDASNDIGIAFDVWLPNAAIAAPIGAAFASPWIDLGSGYLSSSANNILNVNLSAALTGTGKCRVIVAGTEE